MYNYCKTCWHDDGDIGFCDKCYYNHILEEKGIPPTEYEAKPKPITNADRIRSMTDEKLAELFGDMIYPECVCCPADNDGWCKDCKTKWLNWLKEEYTE